MSYEEAVTGHYNRIAAQDGLNPSSTMQDKTVRQKETEAIKTLVAGFLAKNKPAADWALADVGCGNGFTLRTLKTATQAPVAFHGFEYNDKMRELAVQQNAGLDITIKKGDLRAEGFAPDAAFNILVCQRVIINLLDLGDQRKALQNVIRTVKPGGLLIFLEAFQSTLETLNSARAEQDLEPLPPAFHNLYLPEDFFDVPQLAPYDGGIDQHFLSTHYYVSRVLHPAWLAIQKKEFIRNSHFVKFFTSALKEGVGQFAPLRLRTFVKRG